MGRGSQRLFLGQLPRQQPGQWMKLRREGGASRKGRSITPAFITRYIVGQALADPNACDLTALNEPQRKALIRFWEAWQETLKQRANP